MNSTQLVIDLHQVRQNNLKLFETRKPKALDRIPKLSERITESNTGDRSRLGNLGHPRVRFLSFSDEACPSQRTIEVLPEGV